MATRNFVPRANGEGSIGTEKKHWGGGFFDKLAVKTLEVIGGGTENEQPATVGWVKQSFSKILKTALETAGLRTQFGENGYICFGKILHGATIQWGVTTGKVLHDFSFINIRYPIRFAMEPTTLVNISENSANSNAGFPVAISGLYSDFTTVVVRSNGKTSDYFVLRWLSFGFC